MDLTAFMNSQHTSPTMPGSPVGPAPLPPPSGGTVSGSIRPDGPFSAGSFLLEQRQRRFGGAMGVSVAVHAVAIFVVLLLITMGPSPSVVTDTLSSIPAEIIWKYEPGPGGGGGGGGNQMKEPPRKARWGTATSRRPSRSARRCP